MYFPNGYLKIPLQPSLAKVDKKYKILKSSGGDSQDPDYHGGAPPIYNPYYRPMYYNPQYNMAHTMEKKDRDNSQLAYTITIDMELSPGTSLSPSELSNAKCNSKWNSIRKSWSELTGKPYVIPPVYNKMINREKTQNQIPLKQNNTRKYFKGGNHNKTVKLY